MKRKPPLKPNVIVAAITPLLDLRVFKALSRPDVTLKTLYASKSRLAPCPSQDEGFTPRRLPSLSLKESSSKKKLFSLGEQGFKHNLLNYTNNTIIYLKNDEKRHVHG